MKTDIQFQNIFNKKYEVYWKREMNYVYIHKKNIRNETFEIRYFTSLHNNFVKSLENQRIIEVEG